ncbi:hypothetical protein CTA1_2250 [Colletotrichum tanaceti]|uniref:Uncharacterized protein n=1 Tax=Colletotrichum tanaceti TaxID=1306861 RepID=A0A4U6XND8_9PEZI|nr:hypothetical protein CTA1_2250 [Colletotrichum tanaceti]
MHKENQYSAKGSSQLASCPTPTNKKCYVCHKQGCYLTKHTQGIITALTPLSPIEFHVVCANTPFLLCLYDLNCLRIKFRNLSNVLCKGDISIPVVRKWGHAWLLLKPKETIAARNYITNIKLCCLYC